MWKSKSYQIICDKNSMHLAGRKANAMEALMSENAYYDAHEAATERLFPLIQKAVEMSDNIEHILKYADREFGWLELLDNSNKEFLAEIEKEIGDE